MRDKISERLYKIGCRRLQSGYKATGEANAVVKGKSRRVVVVNSPDERIFEQAIFIVRDDYLRSEGQSAKMLLSEAQRAASEYVASRRPAGHRLRRTLYAACGVCSAAAVYFALHFVFGLV